MSDDKNDEKVDFQDTPNFYKRVTKLAKAGKPTIIQTPYTSSQQIPQDLARTFDIGPRQIAALTNPKTGLFIPGATTQAGLNLNYLIILGTAAAGAGIGIFFGPIGIAAGAALGTAIGCVTAAVASKSHVVTLTVSTKGTLIIDMKPTLAAKPTS